MIKDIDYYLNFDFAAAAATIKDLGVSRGSSEVFGEAINALIVQSDERTVSSHEISGVLGLPDDIKIVLRGEVWQYNWLGKHGPTIYSSSTPFLIVDGICKGVESDDDEA